MWARIFPKQFDNVYRGHWAGMLLLTVVSFVKAAQGVTSIIDTRNTAMTADGIPVDSFPPLAANNVVLMFALLGFYLVLVPLQSALALVRYRSMIPLMFIWMLFVQIGARLLVFLHPVNPNAAFSFTGHAIGFYVNVLVLVVTAVGFIFSVLSRSAHEAQA